MRLIHAATGLAAVLVSTTRHGQWVPMLYTTLPLTIGLFVWRFDWGARERQAAGREQGNR